MEGLAGDFSTFSFSDLLQLIGNRGLTGTLTVELGTLKKTVGIREGSIVLSSSNDPKEHFGQFLVNFGYLTEKQLEKAMRTQMETKVFLGQVVVMVGLVTEEKLKQILCIKIRESILDIYRWRGGTFEFDRTKFPYLKQAVESPVALLDVVREGEFRDTAWRSMTSVFPHGGLALRVDESRAPPTASGSLDEKLFQAIREGRTLDEIGRLLHVTDFHLYQRLYALHCQKIVAASESAATETPVAEEDIATVGEELTAADVLRHAQEFLSVGLFEEAETLAARALELGPTPQAEATYREAESGLADQLRSELLGRPMVPRLSTGASNFKDLDLVQAERYLLSKVDGARDLRSIVSSAPLRELDTLKCLRRLLERGLVVLDG